jgi:UDP-glucose 4-epimerase
VKILVTGGGGYIGSVAARHLLDAGHEVTVLDDFSVGHRSAVADEAELIEVDLADRGAVVEALPRDIDAVVHFAARALVEESMRDPALYWRVNAGGSANLLEAMRVAGARAIVFSSTCAVYGVPGTLPITEDLPTAPVNAYGASKLAVDHMLRFEAAANGLAAISLRYFNVAGADRALGERHDPETHLVPRVLRAAAGIEPSIRIAGTDYPTPDGTAIRDYVHVRDLVRAHLLALEALEPGRHAVINLGSERGYSVREVIEAGARVTGRPVPSEEGERRPGDPPVLVASAERAANELGWRPEASLEEMIADAWAFMTETGVDVAGAAPDAG